MNDWLTLLTAIVPAAFAAIAPILVAKINKTDKRITTVAESMDATKAVAQQTAVDVRQMGETMALVETARLELDKAKRRLTATESVALHEVIEAIQSGQANGDLAKADQERSAAYHGYQIAAENYISVMEAAWRRDPK
jgi:hypothetical protein